MKKSYPLIIRYSILILLLFLVESTKIFASWGEFYARSIYPVIARILSNLSGWIPFSLGDLFILLIIPGLIAWLVYARRKSIPLKRRILGGAEYLLWIYVWFYVAWGLNYSQPRFYQRAGIQYTAYDKENFTAFLDEYIEQLNESYTPVTDIDRKAIQREIISEYKRGELNPGIHTLHGSPHVKTMMFSPLFSKMGITGYMGPFFCEFNLNGELLPTQYPATYAHELAHFLGISGEAEANFYAYLVCTRSTDPTIRFCGHFSVMNYVLGNAWRLLDEEEYREVIKRIKPEIAQLSQQHRDFWQSRYSPTIGNIQDWVYNLYLKGNKISSGTKNYSEVVGLLISWREHSANKQ